MSAKDLKLAQSYRKILKDHKLNFQPDVSGDEDSNYKNSNQSLISDTGLSSYLNEGSEDLES